MKKLEIDFEKLRAGEEVKCPKCKNTMVFLELYHNHIRIPLDKLYEKVMKKHKLHS